MTKFRRSRYATVNKTRPRPPKTCCTDVTTSCTNNDANNDYVFVNIILFTKENIILGEIFRQDKCCFATCWPVCPGSQHTRRVVVTGGRVGRRCWLTIHTSQHFGSMFVMLCWLVCLGLKRCINLLTGL